MIATCCNGNGCWIVIELLPTGTTVSSAGFSRILPDCPCVMELIEIVATNSDGNSGRIVIELFPTGTSLFYAGGSSILPNCTTAM
ncbi:MAG: hypothetical protein HC835_06605 [Oscillatoriales cyanobacterium RM2_1_1]|nr:hypothetical protein [Oscillatoriales cyanobacterium RM2_1_1]